jgi:transcription elongation factor GreA
VVDEATGNTQRWTIVGATEADLAKGLLSAESPVGRALLGAAEGAVVSVETPRGKRDYKVAKLLS